MEQTTQVSQASNHSLADTDWHLVEFQSMDDSIGTVRPQDPTLYTMRLNGDGTVTMKLNCNRGNGSWSSEPSDEGNNGAFQFGPLATTRALCPEPSLDEKIAADSEFIRSYVVEGDKLYLSLMADGGIYVWQQYDASTLFKAEPNQAIEAAILEASPDYRQDIIGEDGIRARYVYSQVDLNGDGKEEVLVYLMGSIFCGTGGCDLLVLTEGTDGYSLVHSFPISRVPVIVSDETTEGWKNLVRLESGGGIPPAYVFHVFDGQKYIEQDRKPTESQPDGIAYLAGDPTFKEGVVLEPMH
jgi:heat shock protein HslJ